MMIDIVRFDNDAGGQAQGLVLSDLCALQLTALTWLPPLRLSPSLPPRCRHGLVVTSRTVTAAGVNGTAGNGAADEAAQDCPDTAAEPGAGQNVAWLHGGFDGSHTCGELFRVQLPEGFGATGADPAAGNGSEEVGALPLMILKQQQQILPAQNLVPSSVSFSGLAWYSIGNCSFCTDAAGPDRSGKMCPIPAPV